RVAAGVVARPHVPRDQRARGHPARHRQVPHPRRAGPRAPDALDRGRSMSCAELHDEAAELALGILDGERRAEALAHLDGCARCRALVEDLAEVADLVVATAPAIEPPAGFESRVLVAIGADPVPPRVARRPRTRLAVAAALAAAAALVVAVVVWADP